MISPATERLTQICAALVEEVNRFPKTIYSYVGKNPTHEPVYYEETDLFIKMLAESGLKYEIKEVWDEEFFPEKWDPNSSIIHIPGACSSALDDHLGKKVKSIRDFVEKGGGFLGWCGGAYWACGTTHYGEETSTPIHKERLLALWKGQEVGPLIPYRGNPVGNIGFFHEVVKVKWVGSETFQKLAPNGLQVNVLLSGGGSFVPDKDEHPFRPLSFYEDYEQTKALCGVRTVVKQGNCVLMNPYFTHGADYFFMSLEGYKTCFPDHDWDKVYEKLKEPDSYLKRKICFIDMLHSASPTVKQNTIPQ